MWLCKDNELMVLHGGLDGQLSLYGLDNEKVFEWTKEQLQTKIDLGQGQRIPSLEDVIKVCKKAPKMLLNIELKGPLTEEWTAKYDYDLAAQKTIDLINKHGIAKETIISSFTPQIL